MGQPFHILLPSSQSKLEHPFKIYINLNKNIPDFFGLNQVIHFHSGICSALLQCPDTLSSENRNSETYYVTMYNVHVGY